MTNANMMMNGTAAQQSNSKASTVEMAIEYIKSLQKDLGEAQGKIEALEKEKTTLIGGEIPEATASATNEVPS